MGKFLILHIGFEKPTPEQMAEWNAWFDSVSSRSVDMAHLPRGREITSGGARDLPMAKDSITGFTVIEAESLDEAAAIAGECPIVVSTRVYEIGAG